MYIYYDINTKVEMENGVITVPGGETMWINVEGIARDYSKVQTSETSPITTANNIVSFCDVTDMHSDFCVYGNIQLFSCHSLYMLLFRALVLSPLALSMEWLFLKISRT